jgi:peroxiredoxin
LPSVNKLYSDLRQQGLEVLLVSFRESPDLVKKTVQERGYVAPVLLDRGGEITGVKYGVWGPPTVYLLDRQGRLVARGVGPRDWSRPEARQLLQALLDQR